ncbi:MAG: tetratricopeptide repeat protein [Actinobacteria bacterium]|nr:tetratricopeptide repeat protein [Actinomycetota bacterium]
MSDSAYDLLQQARGLIQERRSAAAVSLLERAKELEPGRGSILEALGIAYYNSGRPELAMREFEEALEVDPTNHYARYGFSRCLYRRGMLQRAIGQVKLAVVMAPEMEIYEEALQRYQRDLYPNGERQDLEG